MMLQLLNIISNIVAVVLQRSDVYYSNWKFDESTTALVKEL